MAPWNAGLPETAEQHLLRRLPELGFEIPDTLADRLLCYLDLLQHWNRAYNLTSVRDPVQMVYRHLLDSLAIAPFLNRGMRRIIDVGSGAGLPGVPLALMFPDREFHLLDSNGKKTRFLFQVKTALGLDNMSVLQSRAESSIPDAPFDAVLSRAFATLRDMIECSWQLCAADGRFLAMKGARPIDELETITRGNHQVRADAAQPIAARPDAAQPKYVRVVAVHAVVVPGLDEERHLVELMPV